MTSSVTMGRLQGRSLLALTGALLAGCVSVDELQTPNGDLGFGAAGAGGAAPVSPEPAEEGTCARDGWSSLRVSGREEGMDWAMPSLARGCSGAPHRLSALAPRLGAALEITLAGLLERPQPHPPGQAQDGPAARAGELKRARPGGTYDY